MLRRRHLCKSGLRLLRRDKMLIDPDLGAPLFASSWMCERSSEQLRVSYIPVRGRRWQPIPINQHTPPAAAATVINARATLGTAQRHAGNH